MAFAASLNKIIDSKKLQVEKRKDTAAIWLDYEAVLLDQAAELFKQRCRREAGQRRTQLTASFEVISREINGFPQHRVKDSTYIVSSWGKGVSPEAWHYATHGTQSSYTPGSPVLFAEMLEGMMPKFIERVKQMHFLSFGREDGTWKVTVSWPEPKFGEDAPAEEEGEETFAKSLTKLITEVHEKDKEKREMSEKWEKVESDLLDKVIDVVKEKCTKEAELSRLECTVSFEVLSRDIQEFPKRVVKDGNFFVESWPEDVTGECWFYSTHGFNATFNESEPVMFAEVLEGMMPKFLEKLKPLGFEKRKREPGTWKVLVTWLDPDEADGSASKKRKMEVGVTRGPKKATMAAERERTTSAEATSPAGDTEEA